MSLQQKKKNHICAKSALFCSLREAVESVVEVEVSGDILGR